MVRYDKNRRKFSFYPVSKVYLRTFKEDMRAPRTAPHEIPVKSGTPKPS